MGRKVLRHIIMEAKAMKIILASMMFLLFTALVSDAVSAKTVSIAGNSKSKVEGRCGESGGAVLAQRKKGHTQRWLEPDQGGPSFGGASAGPKKTCDKVPPACIATTP